LDVTKLTISVKGLGLTGYAASALLNTEFGIQVEMADLFNVLVIVSIGDRKDDLDRLVSGLTQLARRPPVAGSLPEIPPVPPVESATQACTPREAYFAPHAFVPLQESAGRVSADIITIYPPGIPILVPGEVISQPALEYLLSLGARGARVDGVLDRTTGTSDNGLAPGAAPQVRVLA
jgi:arginine/lysine/ornithine decarboxylase